MAKIALLVTNLAGSGAEKVVLNLAEMFKKHGEEVHIFLLEDIVSYDVEGLNIHTLTSKRAFYKLLKGIGDYLLGKKLQTKINKLNQDNKAFDLILSNLPSADRVAVQANLPNTYYVIHTSYSMEIEEFKKRNKTTRANKKEKLYHRLYKDKKLIAVSKGIKEDLDKMKIGYRSCEVIYNPFDIEVIRKQGKEKVSHMIEGEYLLSASAFRPVKRYDILLEAYSKLTDPPPLKLLCNTNPKLEKMIDTLGIRNKVEILGFTKNPYPIIKNAKVLILSSEREGLPTVLVEALILGTPIVSTNCISGPSEILTGDFALYLSRVNDVEDLAAKITKALSNYPQISDCSVEKFSVGNIYKEYQRLEDKDDAK